MAANLARVAAADRARAQHRLTGGLLDLTKIHQTQIERVCTQLFQFRPRLAHSFLDDLPHTSLAQPHLRMSGNVLQRPVMIDVKLKDLPGFEERDAATPHAASGRRMGVRHRLPGLAANVMASLCGWVPFCLATSRFPGDSHRSSRRTQRGGSATTLRERNIASIVAFRPDNSGASKREDKDHF